MYKGKTHKNYLFVHRKKCGLVYYNFSLYILIFHRISHKCEKL